MCSEKVLLKGHILGIFSLCKATLIDCPLTQLHKENYLSDNTITFCIHQT